MRKNLLEALREGKKLTFRQQLLLTMQLSIPAIMAQLSTIVMEYIDASMVGRLGPNDSASIGLVASSTWLLGGLSSAAGVGFTVQIAQLIGAGKEKQARNIVRVGLTSVLVFSVLLLLIGVFISGGLPVWLGGRPEITTGASHYFFIFACSIPVFQMNSTAGGMLQCSGNMKVPSFLHVLVCVLDMLFNALFIFPTRMVMIGETQCIVPGAGLGVAGAAIGSLCAEVVVMILMLYFLLIRSKPLHLRKDEHMEFSIEELKNAARIAIPVGFEQVIMCGAQIASTRIVAPLGTIAIAANSFSVTAESLCYMPGYGIGSAATTLIGQSIGAKRQDLTRRLGWLTTFVGMAVMAVSGAFMYVLAPWMIGLISPDPQIQQLGAEVLRIEAFAEPMYAASIVASGVFRGTGDTFIPSCLNFCSMWFVRIPLAALLAPRLGLRGVWIAMCLELCVRGAMFLVRLGGKKWMKNR